GAAEPGRSFAWPLCCCAWSRSADTLIWSLRRLIGCHGRMSLLGCSLHTLYPLREHGASDDHDERGEFEPVPIEHQRGEQGRHAYPQERRQPPKLLRPRS